MIPEIKTRYLSSRIPRSPSLLDRANLKTVFELSFNTQMFSDRLERAALFTRQDNNEFLSITTTLYFQNCPGASNSFDRPSKYDLK